jgi:hypothetical protein
MRILRRANWLKRLLEDLCMRSPRTRRFFDQFGPRLTP